MAKVRSILLVAACIGIAIVAAKKASIVIENGSIAFVDMVRLELASA